MVGMDSRFEKHFLRPEGVGELDDADGAGQAGEPGCGAVVRFSIHFQGEKIDKARFLASGTPAAIAAGSILTGLVEGSDWRQAAAISPDNLVRAALEGRAGEPELTDAAMLDRAASFAIEALHQALEDALRRDRFPVAPASEAGTVMVAMSGGVDSSTACLLLHEEGRQVIGVTMRLWAAEEETAAAGNSCCSPEAILEARAVCHSLGLPHLTVDYTGSFADSVVSNFVSEYREGRTPNPCVHCNGDFRFPALVALADRLGAATIATGHYARIVSEQGSVTLARGRDRRKDQSYMLARVDAGLLSRLLLPLGEMDKTHTRAIARRAGLAAYSRPESQDICFLPGDDYRGFLRRQAGMSVGQGDIVDTAGNRLGSHEGYYAYTVGQRRGLGVSASRPLYVLGTDPVENRVIVGDAGQLAVTRLEIGDVRQMLPAGDGVCAVQVRYNAEAVPARISSRRGRRWRLELDRPVLGVAPGQAAVIFSGEMVAAAGIIESATA